MIFPVRGLEIVALLALVGATFLPILTFAKESSAAGAARAPFELPVPGLAGNLRIFSSGGMAPIAGLEWKEASAAATTLSFVLSFSRPDWTLSSSTPALEIAALPPPEVEGEPQKYLITAAYAGQRELRVHLAAVGPLGQSEQEVFFIRPALPPAPPKKNARISYAPDPDWRLALAIAAGYRAFAQSGQFAALDGKIITPGEVGLALERRFSPRWRIMGEFRTSKLGFKDDTGLLLGAGPGRLSAGSLRVARGPFYAGFGLQQELLFRHTDANLAVASLTMRQFLLGARFERFYWRGGAPLALSADIRLKLAFGGSAGGAYEADKVSGLGASLELGVERLFLSGWGIGLRPRLALYRAQTRGVWLGETGHANLLVKSGGISLSGSYRF